MTGFKSKKTAALDEEGMYLVHQTASYADNLGKSIVALGKQTVKDIEQLKTQPTQWDTPSEAFNKWWNDDYDDSTNPFTVDTYAYWAWAGWQAALAQPAQEPPPWWPAVENILTEYGLQAIDFVADFNAAMKDAAQPPQRPWVDLTPQDLNEIFEVARTGEDAVRLALDKLKEKNNG